MNSLSGFLIVRMSLLFSDSYRVAAEGKKWSIVERCIDAGASVGDKNFKGNNVLHLCAENDSLPIGLFKKAVRLATPEELNDPFLGNEDEGIMGCGSSILLTAVTRYDVDVIKYLIAHGADPYQKDGCGRNLASRSLSLYALKEDQLEGVLEKLQLCRDYQIDFNEPDDDGISALDRAKRKSWPEVVHWIESADARECKQELEIFLPPDEVSPAKIRKTL